MNGIMTPEIREMAGKMILARGDAGKRLTISSALTGRDTATIERLPEGHMQVITPDYRERPAVDLKLRHWNINNRVIPNPYSMDWEWAGLMDVREYAIGAIAEYISENRAEILPAIRMQNPEMKKYTRILMAALRDQPKDTDEQELQQELQEIQIAARAMVEEAMDEKLLKHAMGKLEIRADLGELVDRRTASLAAEAEKNTHGYSPQNKINIYAYNLAIMGEEEIALARKKYPAALAWAFTAKDPGIMPLDAQHLDRIARAQACQQGLLPGGWDDLGTLPTKRIQMIIEQLRWSQDAPKHLNTAFETAREFQQHLPRNRREFQDAQRRLKQGTSHFPKHIRETIQDLPMELACPQVYRWAQRHIQEVNTNRFLIARMHPEKLRGLERHNPGALVAAMGLGEFNQSPNHPGQVIQEAKRVLQKAGLNPKRWRTAATLPAVLMRNIIRTGGNAGETAAAVELIAQAQAAPAPTVMKTIGMKAGYSNAERNPNQRQAAILIIRESALRLVRNPRDRKQQALQSQTGDLMDYCNSLGSTILRARSFRGLAERSRKWHRDLAEEHNRSEWNTTLKRQGNIQHAWNSLAGPIRDRGLRVTPLCEQKELFDEGKEMRHCVANYWQACRKGESRIFSITQEGMRVATGELRLGGDRWIVAQVKSQRNHPAPPAALQAMTKVCTRYNQEWAKNPDHRSWEISSQEDRK